MPANKRLEYLKKLASYDIEPDTTYSEFLLSSLASDALIDEAIEIVSGVVRALGSEPNIDKNLLNNLSVLKRTNQRDPKVVYTAALSLEAIANSGKSTKVSKSDLLNKGARLKNIAREMKSAENYAAANPATTQSGSGQAIHQASRRNYLLESLAFDPKDSMFNEIKEAKEIASSTYRLLNSQGLFAQSLLNNLLELKETEERNPNIVFKAALSLEAIAKSIDKSGKPSSVSSSDLKNKAARLRNIARDISITRDPATL